MKPFVTLNDKFLPAQGLVVCLVDLAKQRGLNLDKLLNGTGIFREDLLQPDYQVSLSQIAKLLNQFQRLMPGNDAPFQLGHRLFPDLSVQACAIKYSANLSQALRLVSRFRMYLAPFLFGFSYRHQEFNYMMLNDAVGLEPQQYQFVVELYCTLLVSVTRQLLGHRLPIWFSFPFARPRHIQEYEEHLGLKISFNQPSLCVRFESKYLIQALPQASELRQQLALRQISNSEQNQRTLVEAVSIYLRQHRQGDLHEVASHLNLSPATLKRRLKDHRLRFSELQDRVNIQQAYYLLTVKGLKNELAAEKMAFNDVPNFRRACKRWTGFTPSELRAM
jgi:AraC-like DNA-binding protein